MAIPPRVSPVISDETEQDSVASVGNVGARVLSAGVAATLGPVARKLAAAVFEVVTSNLSETPFQDRNDMEETPSDVGCLANNGKCSIANIAGRRGGMGK